MFRRINKKIILILLSDIIVIQIASFLSLFVRFDFVISGIPVEFIDSVIKYSVPNTIIIIIVFILMKLYRSVWKFAGVDELINIVLSCIIVFFLQLGGMHLFNFDVPRSYFFFFFMFLSSGITFIRFSYRILRIVKRRGSEVYGDKEKNVMIIGAGSAAEMIIKELENSYQLNRIKIACLVDDNIGMRGKYLRGILIAGGRNDIIKLSIKYEIDEIIVAIPSADIRDLRAILNICKETKCELKTLPGMYQLINGEVSISKLKKVEIEDLLGRTPIKVKLESVMHYVTDKTVLVTGGGGSIGSELCRQVAEYSPTKLIIIDIYENNAYDIQNELKKKFPELDFIVLIASVRNEKRLEYIFEKYKPEVVYHAAAHKHVPLMEDSPCEAIKNNVFGTFNTAKMADKYNAEKFILISTDKAVNPTNIMGASKRLCEMVIQSFSKKSETEFVAVRFGNVLGSNGSVIPLFKKQISEGGPVKVTHPDIIRYFMTIQEAVSLVLQAGAFAKGGEIFVLDMGEPVRIVELAENLIKLSGYKVGEDIKIEFTGLRPGEKLYEEMLMQEEGMTSTANNLIFIGQPIEFNEAEFESQLAILEKAANDEDEKIKEVVCGIVNTYCITNN